MLGLVSTEWSYERHGTEIVCDEQTSRRIEMAYSKDDPTVCINLHGEEFVVDLMTKIGHGQQTGENITLRRKWLGPSTDPAAGECLEIFSSSYITVKFQL